MTLEARCGGYPQVSEIVGVGTFIEEDLGFFSDLALDGEVTKKEGLLPLLVAEGNSGLLVKASSARWHPKRYRRAEVGKVPPLGGAA